MPEHYRALLVVLVLSGIVFAFVKAQATALAISTQDFVRRRNYWFYLTISAFLAPNFWVFVFAACILLYKAEKQEANPIALFMFLLLAVPQIREYIPTFGLVGVFVAIDYVRILILMVLLPAALKARKEAKKNNSGYLSPDLFLLGYSVINLFIRFQNDSLTGFLRSLPLWTIDILIPYYAISRSVKTLGDFRDVLMSFVIAALLVSAVGIFEFLKHWLLYSSLESSWGIQSMAIYLLRADLLRAIATSGQAIVLGYVIAAAIGAHLFLRFSVPSKYFWWSGLMLLVAGEVSPLSKGPWVGAVAMIFVYLMLSPQRLSHAIKLIFIAPLVILLLLSTSVGGDIMGFLPFVGTVDEGSAAYRQQLFDTSIKIILDNPVFGSSDYLLQMENMRQGQGIIDLVNTFLIVALNSGFVGLGIFTSFFGAIMWGIFHAKSHMQSNVEMLTLGNCLLAVLTGILVIISSVSPISHVVIIYISVAAFGVAYRTCALQLSEQLKSSKSAGMFVAPSRT